MDLSVDTPLDDYTLNQYISYIDLDIYMFKLQILVAKVADALDTCFPETALTLGVLEEALLSKELCELLASKGIRRTLGEYDVSLFDSILARVERHPLS